MSNRRDFVGKTARLVIGIAIICVSLIAFLVGWQSTKQKPITIVVGDSDIRWDTKTNTVANCLYELGITLSSKDEVIPALDAPIVRGMEITINRGFDISIKDGDKDTLYTVTAPTVSGALAKLGILVDQDDRVTPSLSSKIGPGSKVTIVRVENTLVKEKETIPYVIWEFPDNRLDENKTKVWRKGSNGLKELVYQVRTENGKTVSKVLVEENLIEESKIHVVARGTKPVYYTLKTSSGSILYTKKMRIEATAYYPGPESTGRFADGITSVGLKAGHGIIAVDPRVIPLWTKVYIPNYGFAIAGDVGGAIKGNIIDLCFDTYREAIQFGRRKVDLYILADQGR